MDDCRMAVKPRNVSAAEWDALNERFYRMSPHSYLEQRLRSLVLTISDDTDTGQLWDEGVGYRAIKISGQESAGREGIDRYAALESTVLLHHASESLLRLYLAHEYRTMCPWEALSAMTSFRDVKARLTDLQGQLDDDARLDDLMEVFVYTPDSSKFPGVSAEQWAGHRNALRLVLGAALEEVLGHAHIYNAAKHGLALLAGEVGMSLGEVDNDPVISQSGPALTYLERAPDWQITTTWVQPERNIALTVLVMDQLRNLWNVAQTHRLRAAPQTFNPLTVEAVEQALHYGFTPGFNVQTMSEKLATE